ncbi:Vacuolar protein sorting-associated protein 70 [Polyrhizophydium stewartii]|uniref:Vacuolar protein sorting-associated protein 70 n=1 Tax=Polyrhizophydium stewartii TaxID=2732419 RepID=A0ABR4MW53_9FUNG
MAAHHHNPFAIDDSDLHTNPFADPAIADALDTPAGRPEYQHYSAAAPAREEQLRKREAELAERERELRQQQEDLRRQGVHPPNWPPFYPLVHHDIDVAIAEDKRPAVRRLYQYWLAACGLLVLNMATLLIIMFSHPDNMNFIPGDFGVALVYVFFMSTASFATWYFPAYLGFKNNSSLYSYIFLLFHGFHILFLCYMAVGIPGSGSAGLITVLAVFGGGRPIAGVFAAIVFAGWVLSAMYSIVLWKTVRDFTLRSGLTLENARNEAVSAGIRSGVAQEAARQGYTRSTTGHNLTAVAHIAGSDADRAQAEAIQAEWAAAGLPNTHIKTYFPLLNRPVSRSLTLLAPERFEATLREPAVDGDDTSRDEEVVPTFLGYSPSGNVTAELVYANFGSQADFAALAARGIDVRGKIVLVRYGSAFRGHKVRAAELAGAAAVLIYSDPAEDGFVRGPVYPDGPWRPPLAVQRGTIQYPFYEGDPLTPFVAATENATRLPQSEAPSLPKIPALPISYGEAKPFLAALKGHGVAAHTIANDWQGGLDIEYWTGPAGKAHLFIDNEFAVKPIWNTMAVIEGTSEPDRAIVIGSHRDAWVYGALDPSSSAAVVIEIGRVLGKMHKRGWRPDRTIVIATWDGEEYGLLGSTEWVEDHVEILNKTAVAYINLDGAVSGPNFEASASPALANLVRKATKEVKDPQTGRRVYKRWNRRAGVDTPEGRVPRVQPLGSGSDYTPFLQHVGIAAVDMRFTGDYGVYHSNYDSFNWMAKFGDPTWKYHEALTLIVGRVLLPLAHDRVLPIDFVPYVHELRTYAKDVAAALGGASMPVEWAGRLDASIDVFEKAARKLRKEADQLRRDDADEDDAVVDAIDGRNDGLDAGVSVLAVQGGSDDGLAGIMPQQHPKHPKHSKHPKHPKDPKHRAVNDKLGFGERGFIDMAGIPGREWYRHVVYAPGEWSGYGAEMFPAIHESIRRGDSAGTDKIIASVAATLRCAAGMLAA